MANVRTLQKRTAELAQALLPLGYDAKLVLSDDRDQTDDMIQIVRAGLETPLHITAGTGYMYLAETMSDGTMKMHLGSRSWDIAKAATIAAAKKLVP